MTKQKPSQRKALRSAAAKQYFDAGYELGRQHGRFEAQRTPIRINCISEPAPSPLKFTLTDELPPPDPTPSPPNWLHRIWAKITGTA